MEDHCKTLKEAESFFLKNSEGSCVCEKDGNAKECASFPEAEAFFNEEAPVEGGKEKAAE